MSFTIPMTLLAFACVLVTGCASTAKQSCSPCTQAAVDAPSVLHYADIEWGPLNPARGDNSPRAGTLWGDRGADTATGFLVQFKDGFSSPPHIHNVTYRGIVISGLIHNDDPDAAKMWMPAGSYWTQPEGEAHITAAMGDRNMAYIEINSGPYLVRPTDQAFDNGERPINVDAANLIWLNADEGAQIAHLWGSPSNGNLNGSLIRLPKNFSGTFSNSSSLTRAVVIQGQIEIQSAGQLVEQILEVGSALETSHPLRIQVNNNTNQDSIVYVRSEGALSVSP